MAESRRTDWHLGLRDRDGDVDAEDLPLRGTLPEWLRGTLLRNGPASWRLGPDRRLRHWFDGWAMLHRFRIADGRVSYRSRFLPSVASQARLDGRLRRREFASDPPRPWWKRPLAFVHRTFTDNAGVTVLPQPDGWTARTESPDGHWFDPLTLDHRGAQLVGNTATRRALLECTMDEADHLDRIVAAVRAGDTEAYRGIVERLGAWLRMVIAPRCPPGVDPDEVAHQTFVDAYFHLGEYAGGDLRAWIATIAIHRALAAAKTVRRERARRVDLVADELAASMEETDGGGADEATVAALRACLDELGDGAADLIARRYRAGTAVQDIAAALGRTPGAIAKSLHLIRARLHDCIRRRLAGGVA